MTNAKIDENKHKTALAVDETTVVKRLLVDSTTGRLLIDVSLDNTAGTVNTAKIDENSKHVALGHDETSGIIPFHVHSSNNYLLIDLILE